MKVFKELFASLYVAIPLMAIYAILIAVATFVENDYGSNVARALIYNTWFFDVLHIWILLCLVGVIIRYKLLKQKKYASLMLHLSFILIIVGAGVTRFFGQEGMMHIREGERSSTYTSSENYLNVLVSTKDSKYDIHIPTNISYISNKALDETIYFGDNSFHIKSTSITKMNNDKKDNTTIIEATIDYKNKSYPLQLIGGNGVGQDSLVSLDDGTNVIISWGSKDVDLGFSITLNKFILTLYPGSMAPSSYKSEITLNDGDFKMPYEIFMNNTLDYKGYRFFQSSYDPDGKGTYLSVNKDPGKIPTYIGYFLLIISSIYILFAKNGRFQKLSRFLASQQIYSIIFLSLLVFNTNLLADEGIDSSANIAEKIKNFKQLSKEQASKFGELQVQTMDGRIEPLDTLAADLVHKITGENDFLGLSNDQIILGMLVYPNDWKSIKMIKISAPKLKEIIGIPENQDHASFLDFFITQNKEDDINNYKLKNYIEDADRKSPNMRDKFDEDVIKVNERLNIAFSIYSSQYFRIFPIPNNGSTWASPMEMILYGGKDLSSKIGDLVNDYFLGIDEGLKNNNWQKADSTLQKIKAYQKEFSDKNIYLSDYKLKAEIFFNHADIFKQLILPYILVGILMLILVFVYIFNQKETIKKILRFLYYITAVLVLIHLVALALRWYISGHAPWSNAYESMIYIAFAAGIAGVVFFRKSYLAISAATFLAGISLFVALLGNMNPQITNLVPVLKSYWLNIHVSVITASYGFLGLCFLLGIITLILFVIRNNNHKIDSTINSITAINEMAMIFGLLLLTVGNFLGAIWANESWGRYWGWDPKETWALVSIGVYAIILHLRFIFKKNLQYIFATSSVVGFASVLMTYFGVNYFLSGLHSYGAGNPIHNILYYVIACIAVALVIILIGGAYFKRNMKALKI